jgi:hypothetical protein
VYDVSLQDEIEPGYPILFTNQEIRRMLRLASVNRQDVFCDLGSGWGQNLILALTEFGAKKAIGIERNADRREMSLDRLKRLERKIPTLKGRYVVVDADFEELLDSPQGKGLLSETTVIFYGLSSGPDTVEGISRNWTGTKNRRLAYYFLWLFPWIMPSGADYPFYVSKFPFKTPPSEREWLAAIVGKTRSLTAPDTKPDTSELWDEITHDYDVKFHSEEIRYLKRELRKAIRNPREAQ